MPKPNLLILDDEIAICKSLSFILEDDYEVYASTDPDEAIALFSHVAFSIALLDLRLGMRDGIEVLKQIRSISPRTIVIIMTAYGSIPSAVEAMRQGAFYYAAKPIDIHELKVLLEKAMEQFQLQSRVEWLNEEIQKAYDVHGLIGHSSQMQNVFSLIDKVKNIDSSVLIMGESGTGKELVARAIHFAGDRQKQVFSTINCAAIPANLIESELFGYEKGAFTGAVARKTGIFETANGGTLFLDEIGELDIGLQSKLLRVLQEKAIMRIGGQKEIAIDVRIIAATNRDLKKEIQQGKFREDLYYRLNVIPILLPPLRERQEDIPSLIQHFINKINERMSKQIKGIEPDAVQLLLDYPFPGNVRELQNIIERSIALADGDRVTVGDLPGDLQTKPTQPADSKLVPVYVGETMDAIERKVILSTLQAMDGNRRKTAETLGIGERTLRDKLARYRAE
ncbi:acetoacetate metabolism regulatory protein AtoC [Paenibacillus tyrfis]|uniref:sigma-54-dependent transcriptional regulator n=1 Tax=Paenibacillus tyrfis TaxID=1501230 RepID=UPI002492DD33|nr:sigma-54 dependent transcriptional regulator [Paenibacillus tyrfis]GLI10432.1 acetoacetate metabolism regulatory protein AtoC [Paenibacillus tyrfis]